MATRYGNFGLTFTPSTGVDPGLDQNPGWMQLFADNLARLPAVQAIEQAREMMLPSDPNYGLTADSLKGYEEYAESFLEVRSQAQEDALKARIDKNRERIDRIDEYGGFSSMLAAEALNPINLVPLPLVRGAGFIKGMLRSGAALGGTLTAEELLRHGVDPTATTEESIDNIVYGTLFGAAIGGLIGKVGAKDIQDLATQYSKWRRVENDEIADIVDEQAPIIGSETGFTAKPTGDVATGPAPAFGLEAVTRMTLAGKLKSSGIRAVEDLVDAMAGTMGYMNAKNLQKIPTETSAYLASKAWNGAGVAAIERLRRVYVEYLGGSKPMEILGLNIPVIKSQIGDMLRRGGGRPDGKMTYEEFKDAVFRAHKPDRIEADDDFVRRGAEVIRPFYEKALNEGSEWGSIPSQKGIRRKLQNKTKRMRDMTTRYEELAAKSERNVNEQLEMNLMESELRRTLEMFEMLERRLVDSEALGKRIEDIEASVKTAAKETLGDMAAKIEERMAADQAILADLEGQIASGKRLTERQQFLVELLKARLGISNTGRVTETTDLTKPISWGNAPFKYPAQQVWHGSLYDFDELKTDKIGSGEGAQMFGWGLYFAQVDLTSKGYMRDLAIFPGDRADFWAGDLIDKAGGDFKLAKDMAEEKILEAELLAEEAFQRVGESDYTDELIEKVEDWKRAIKIIDNNGMIPEAHLYQIDIPSPDNLLTWDAKIAEQSPQVLETLNKLKDDGLLPDDLVERWDTATGEDVVRSITAAKEGHKAASQFLAENGIPGSKHLDGKSRDKGDLINGTYNYVIFDDRYAKIKERKSITEVMPSLFDENAVDPVRPSELFGKTNGALNLKERPSQIDGVKIVYGPTGKRAMATYRRNENTVYFDLDGILASWEQKPWRDPKVKGVFALDDADFPTPEAWAEFNMRHELAHSRVDRFNKSKLNIYPSDNKVARLFALPDGRFTDDFDLAREAAGNVNDVRYVDVFARGKEPVDNAVSRRFDTAEDGTFRSKGGELKLRGFTTDVKAQYENAMNAIALNEMRKGITPAQRSLIEKLDLTIQNPREGMTAKQLAYVDKLEDMIARGAFDGDFEGPKNGVPYLNRHWLIDRVNENEAELRVILADWFTKNPLPGASMTPDAISKRVDDAIASIRKEASADDLPVAMDMGGPSFTMGRKLDIPNELVADFIETDVERLIRTYANRFGLVHEYTRAFGEFSAEDAIGDTMLQAAREIKADSVADGLAQLRSLEADIVRLRDYQTGAVYSVDPLMLNRRRLAANLKAYGTLTTMGRAAYSAIGEAARPLMVHGFGRTFGFAFDALIKGMDRGKAVTQEMAELTGDIADVALSSTFQRFVEMGGPTGAPTTKVGRGAEKMTRFAQGPYFILNGLALVTDALKRYGLTATSQFMLEDLQKLASGKGGSKFESVMASYGFTPEDAKAIMAQPIDKTGNVWLPNTGEWTDPDLVRKFSTAVTAMNNRLVVTAGPDDIPEIAKGFVKGREYPLLTLPFQFWNFGFAAQNKVALSALQGRDANALGGAAAMIAMGGVVAYLKTPEMVWENMEAEEKLIRSVDQSGLLAIYGDIPTMVETATLGNVSARSMIGLEPYVRNPDYADLLGEVGGPAVGKAADITKLFLDGDIERQEVASTIRRSIPLNDLFYWRDLWRDAEKGLLEATE